jgi:hypothetical protein
VNNNSRSASNQNCCRRWRKAKEKTIEGSGHDHDQEAELMVWAASLRRMVKELVVSGKGRKRRRRKSAEGR